MSALPEFNTVITDEIKIMPAAHEKLVERCTYLCLRRWL